MNLKCRSILQVDQLQDGSLWWPSSRALGVRVAVVRHRVVTGGAGKVGIGGALSSPFVARRLVRSLHVGLHLLESQLGLGDASGPFRTYPAAYWLRT